MITIAPSILSADFSNLGLEIKAVESYCKMIHVDVMDGHFVDNITFGPDVVKALRKRTKHVLDVHLMIKDPKTYVPRFAQAGADIITIHAEVTSQKLFKALADMLHKQGKRIGISLRPKTPVTRIFPYLEWADVVLVMSVEPGFGGQAYLPKSNERLARIKKEILRRKKNIVLEVDGGINDQTAISAARSGADVLIAGSYVFGTKDYRTAIITLLRAANGLSG